MDIDEQVEHLARASPAGARRFPRAVQRAFAALAAMPEMGSPWKATRPEYAGLRAWSVRRFKQHVMF
jgi:plasmid stabilization system protein ParE